ncbi:Translation initiation factor 3 subunit J component [Naganishia albida]|nr:Translation initiation factor 3 subunit J component [Naganishia albida]
MDDDWDVSDNEAPATTTASKPTAGLPALAPPIVSRNRRFEGEDEEEAEDDWDASSGDEAQKSAAAANGVKAPVRKKKGLKAILAEKEAAKAAGKEDDLIDEMTPQERRRMQMEMEREADAQNAADLMGSASLEDDVDINTLLKANPKTKTEWQTLARQISTVLFQRLHAKPLYDEFAVEIAKQVATPLNDRDVRKIGTAMTVLSNEKQKEAKASVGGKKKKAAKPVLGASKDVSAKADLEAYDDVLDDDDFM